MSGSLRRTDGSPMETRPWLTSFWIRYTPGWTVWMSEGTGGTSGFVPGQLAKAASSFWIITGRENDPDTAAIMFAGWKYFLWQSTRSWRVSDCTEAAVVQRLV